MSGNDRESNRQRKCNKLKVVLCCRCLLKWVFTVMEGCWALTARSCVSMLFCWSVGLIGSEKLNIGRATEEQARKKGLR